MTEREHELRCVISDLRDQLQEKDDQIEFASEWSGNLESALESLVDRCNNDASLSQDDAVIHAEATLERLYKARAAR